MAEGRVNQKSPRTAILEGEFAVACGRLLGRTPDRISFPGGTNRKSAIARCDGEEYVMSRRGSAARADLEGGVLAELARFEAPTPRLIAREGRWLIQERLEGDRLSTAIDSSDPAGRRQWLHRAAQSLMEIHEAGRRAGLERKVVTIGARAGWLAQLVDMPRRAGLTIGVPAPALPTEALAASLAVAKPQFIKWDARPGNAMAAPAGRVFWFDWEHCGCRDPLDDLAWLLGDEWTPEDEGAENEVIARHLNGFSGTRSEGEALSYLMTFGTFHMAVRLSLIVEHRGKGPWWDRAICLRQDKIGVTPEGAGRICRRAARWAAQNAATAPLSRWFRDVEEKLLTPLTRDTRP